jgi:hypothetical protein
MHCTEAAVDDAAEDAAAVVAASYLIEGQQEEAHVHALNNGSEPRHGCSNAHAHEAVLCKPRCPRRHPSHTQAGGGSERNNKAMLVLELDGIHIIPQHAEAAAAVCDTHAGCIGGCAEVASPIPALLTTDRGVQHTHVPILLVQVICDLVAASIVTHILSHHTHLWAISRTQNWHITICAVQADSTLQHEDSINSACCYWSAWRAVAATEVDAQ